MSSSLNKWIWDLETFPNIFTFSIIREDGKFAQTFEVSYRKNEIDRIMKCLDYLHEQDHYLVGFNSISFDYPVMHKLINLRDSNKMPVNGETIAKRAYKFAQEQIDSFKGQFPNTVRESDRYVRQIDLFKIHHFDNKAKSTSLKMLEFNMREDNIEDLPYPVGVMLNSDQCDVLIKYNAHDVKMTLAFYNHSLAQVLFREKLTHKYNRDFINHSDAKIGGDYFVMELEKAGIPLYTKDSEGKRKIRQTKRSSIKVKDCLFNYYDFKRPEFIAIKEWLEKQTITETKGVFSDLDEADLGDVAKYAEMVVRKKKFKQEPTRLEYNAFLKEHPKGWVEKVELAATEYLLDSDGNHVFEKCFDVKGKEKTRKIRVPKKSFYGCWREAETLNVVVNGFRLDFGTGGLHGSLQNKVVKETKLYKLIDGDVSSMYPNIGISNNVYPLHLSSKFCEIYKDVYEQRKSFPKTAPENAMLKLALNATYGNSNNQYSVFYDPKYTMDITLNGQLSLCLLIERVLDIEGTLMVGANTDGITVALKRDKEDEYYEACKKWEVQVKLELEFVTYTKMFIRDVNNYLCVYDNGKLKNKGAYEYKDLAWNKNMSSLIIPMAVEAHMLNGVDYKEFIKNHTNIFDFMLRTKVQRNSKLVLSYENGTEELQQNICRYYPCKTGGKLVKIMPPLEDGGEERRLGIDTSWNVKTCNDIKDFAGDIDYDYYISEVEKLIIT
jgi:hypothetical protein